MLVGSALFIIGMQYTLTPHHIVVSQDHRWSPDYQNRLRKKIEKLAIRTIGATRLRDDLVKEFPFVKEVTFAYKSSLEATAYLSGWNPLVLVRSTLAGNREYIVCEKGTVLGKRYFTQKALQGIPVLTIEGDDFEEKRRQPELIDTTLNLKQSLFDDYIITWHSKTDILLEHREKPIIVTADIESVHDQDRYAYIHRIFDTEKKYRRGIKADIRLKDSIVCAPFSKSNRS